MLDLFWYIRLVVNEIQVRLIINDSAFSCRHEVECLFYVLWKMR